MQYQSIISLSHRLFFCCLILLTLVYACKPEDCCTPPSNSCGSQLSINWNILQTDTTPYVLQTPAHMPPLNPNDPANKLTLAKVELGRMLFYDPVLSRDSTQSCASCHAQSFGFSDNNKQFSTGIDGIAGDRNAMAIINLAWNTSFFWDGRSPSLEDQALQPVTNPIEMHNVWSDAVCKLMDNLDYRKAFYKAFGIKTITPSEVTEAIAQFERTLVSGNSLFDQAITPGTGVALSDQVDLGYQIFFSEKGDCFHCHGTAKLFMDNDFHNNGLDEAANLNDFVDKGLGKITQNPNDNGRFKTPTLRNVALTPPYMHDGRFNTLMEVVDHYNTGVKDSPNLDIVIQTKFQQNPNGTYGLGLTQAEKEALVAFLESLTDSSFVQNSAFKNPFE